MTVGFIAGSFDIIHPGYIKMFHEAKEIVDFLIIGLQRDPSVERPLKIKPLLSWDERSYILYSIKYIDLIYEYSTEADLIRLLNDIYPDIRFLGDDYKGKSFTGDNLNIPIIYLERLPKWSTTKLKKDIHKQMEEYYEK